MVHVRSASLAVLAASAIGGVTGLPTNMERDNTAQVIAAASAASPQQGVANVISALAKLGPGSKRSGQWRQEQERDNIPHYLIHADLSGDGAPERAHGDLLNINLKRAGMGKGEEFGPSKNYYDEDDDYVKRASMGSGMEFGGEDDSSSFYERARLGLGEVFGHWSSNAKRAGMGKGEEFGGSSDDYDADDDPMPEQDNFAGYKRHGSWFARRLFPSHRSAIAARDKVQVLSHGATPQDTAIMADTNAVIHGNTMLFSAAPQSGEARRALPEDFGGAPGYIDITTPVFNSAATKLASLVLSASDDKTSDSAFVLNASSNVRSEVYLVPLNASSDPADSLSAQSADVAGDDAAPIKVNLKVPVFVASSAKVEAYCATFDPSPSTPAPLGVLPCGKGADHTSQTFLYQPDSGVIEPDWSPSAASTDATASSNITSASAVSSSASSASASISASGSVISSSAASKSGSNSASASASASSAGALKAAAGPSLSHSFSFTSYHASTAASASVSASAPLSPPVLAAAASSHASSLSASASAAVSSLAPSANLKAAAASASDSASGSPSTSSAPRTFSKAPSSSLAASSAVESVLAASATSSIPELPMFSSVSSLAASAVQSASISASVSSVAAAGSSKAPQLAAAAASSSAKEALTTITVTSTSTINVPASSATPSTSGPNNITLIFSPSNASVKGGDKAPAPASVKSNNGAAPAEPKAPAGENEMIETIDEIIPPTSGQHSTADDGELKDVNGDSSSTSTGSPDEDDSDDGIANEDTDGADEDNEEEEEDGSELTRRSSPDDGDDNEEEGECADGEEYEDADDDEEAGEAEYDDGQYHESQFDDGQYHPATTPAAEGEGEASQQRRGVVSKRDLMAQMPMMMRTAFEPYQWTWTPIERA